MNGPTQFSVDGEIIVGGLGQVVLILEAGSDGLLVFRHPGLQYESLYQYTFLDYLIQMQKKFGKLILFIDRARQHHRSIMVREYIKQNKDVLKVIYFPKDSGILNRHMLK